MTRTTAWASYEPQAGPRRRIAYQGYRQTFRPIVARKLDGRWERADATLCGHDHYKRAAAASCGRAIATRLNVGAELPVEQKPTGSTTPLPTRERPDRLRGFSE